MRYLLNIIIVYLSFSSIAFGQADTDSLFAKGNEAYKNKQFFDAIELYSVIIEHHENVSAEVYYNLGNAYYKTGDFSRAILNYERALLLNPSDEDIQFNLAKAKTYLVDKIEVIPDFFVKTWFKKILIFFDSNLWAILALLFFNLSITGILIYNFTKSVAFRKLSFILSILFLFFSVFALSFAFKTRNYIEESNSAIVLEPTVRVKSSPDLESNDMFIIHEGLKVDVIREIGTWSEIRLSDGKQGWMQSENFEKI
ncbi:MAG: tetratricopeptide repeat protein [Bacteroidales bacterium]|nr:tetratricopeptide repeat protein [Bacteroidales bacterium]MBN2820155.1 tetratricopeptide repeat protein [Bacteroidales bacterium]